MKKEVTDRSRDEKDARVLLTDDLRVCETHDNEQRVVSVSGSNIEKISLRMLSGNVSSKLSPP